MGAWLFERSRRLEKERERLARVVAEYEGSLGLLPNDSA
jgi:hypothetical protein